MNKRRDDRADINFEVNGSLVVDNSFSLLNISDSGALIRIPQKLTLGNLYHLKFEFINHNTTIQLKLKTKIVREHLVGYGRSSLNSKIPLYEVGLSFFDTSKEDIKKLKLFIAKEELDKKKYING